MKLRCVVKFHKDGERGEVPVECDLPDGCYITGIGLDLGRGDGKWFAVLEWSPSAPIVLDDATTETPGGWWQVRG